MDVSATNQEIANATIALAVVGALAFLASVAIALLTFFAVRATQRSASATETAAQATAAAAQATRDEAEATKKEAEASLQVVEEMKADRELQWSPILDRTQLGNLRFNVTNLGGGPAVKGVFVIVEGNEWWKSDTFNLAPNETREVTLIKQASPPPPRGETFVALIGKDYGEALICVDRFGAYHRFVTHLDRQPDVWRPNTAQLPWVAWGRGLLYN